MSFMEGFQIWLMAFFTLAIFSFLYRDNPIYRFAEHLFAGLSAGYYVALYTWIRSCISSSGSR